jgi:ABC-type sugar transport system permease subunit
VGFQNWNTLITDSVFWKSLSNNIQIVVLSLVIQLPLGFLIAILLTEIKRFGRFLKTVYFFPMLMLSAAIGILFKNMLNPNFGVVVSALNLLGQKPIDLLGSPNLALFTVIMVVCWQFVPYYMVFFLAAITTIPNDIRDYAKIDGANKFQYYTRIVIPMLNGYIRTAALLTVIGSLKYFDLVFVMTYGGPNSVTELMSTYMYKTAFTSYKVGYGSAIAFALFIIVVGFSLLTQGLSRLIGKKWSF